MSEDSAAKLATLEVEITKLKTQIDHLDANQQVLTQALRETQQQLQSLMRYVKSNEHNQN